MNAAVRSGFCAASITVRSPFDTPEDVEAKRLVAHLGPQEVEPPVTFQCGAPWTAFADDRQLLRLSTLEGRAQRKKAALKEITKERTQIMMCCIRRMRRAKGVE